MPLRTGLKRAAGKAFSTTFYGRLAAHAALQRQFRSVFHIPRVPARERVWDDVIAQVGAATPVLYLEFGVWEGYSIRYFAERFTSAESRFVGCDSFYGLPEDWGATATGAFSTNGRVPQIADTRVAFVQGWFQNSFPQVADLIARHGEGRTVICHFDADIYSSTLFLLSQLHGLLDGYRFVFDEFTGEESLALLNYLQAYGAEPNFGSAHFHAGLPVQVQGVLTTGRGRYEPA